MPIPLASKHVLRGSGKCALRGLHTTTSPERHETVAAMPLGTTRWAPLSDQIELDFALEAKCYCVDSGVGVEAQSRLISRLRPRQFGVLVTTSFVSEQAYGELRDDNHPVVILSGGDIVDILADHQISTVASTAAWLEQNFARVDAPG